MKYWFSSDWHLGHFLMLKIFRQKFNTIDDMNKSILNLYSKTIKPGDHFYFLGDLGMNKKSIIEFFELYYNNNTCFYWIMGNHDYKFKSLVRRIENEYTNVHVYDMLSIRIKGQDVTLCHYPMTTWNKSHYGAWQLYGHHHLDYTGEEKKLFIPRVGKQINVAYDMENKIYEWDDIINMMAFEKQNWDFI